MTTVEGLPQPGDTEGATSAVSGTENPQPSAQSRSTPQLTILYDNYVYDPRLTDGYGFAAAVETEGHRLLFDTGADAPTLLSNMRLMNIEPNGLEAVVLSHIHGDHVGGLEGLLATGCTPTVYLLPSFPAQFKSRAQSLTQVVEVSAGMNIVGRAFSTGEIEGPVREQALVLESEAGLVVMTGCAHPGVVEIVRRTSELFGEPVHLLVGGFHLGSRSESEVAAIIESLRSLRVERVAPCHCTGDRAIAQFRREYGEQFIEAGVGREVLLGP